MQWFSVSSEVLDRDDLNVYEKICYVYLAKHLQSDQLDLSMADLAQQMGVEEIVAKGAFHALRVKGIIESETTIKPGTIIKANTEAMAQLESGRLSYDEKVNRVFEIIDENINEKEAKIILNFAGNDLEKIKEKYKVAKASQFQDKIEVLIHELQKKQTGRIIKKEAVTAEAFESFSLEEPDTSEDRREPFVTKETHPTQVNTYKLNLMKKYKKK